MNESGFHTGREPSEGVRIPIGSQSGRYRFFKVRRYGKLHFLKCPAEEYRYDLLTVEALRKEFEIGYTLDHPGIVRYLAYEEGGVYEEFVDGLTLREMMSRLDVRLLDEDFLRTLAGELLEALSYIHKHGITHLDIKPENVMVSNIGNHVKLVDFGCAASAVFDTTKGGTPSYMAPEQASGGKTNVYTDLYQVGKLMEELARRAGCLPDWKAFIEKSIVPDPGLRFGSAEEARKAIPTYDSQPVPPIPEIEKPSEGKTGCIGQSGKASRPAGSFGGVLRILFWIAALVILIWVTPVREIGVKLGVQSLFSTGNSGSTPTREFEHARLLLQGKGMPRDEEEGMRLMQIAAEKGDAVAQCYLGLMYRDGSAYTPRDYAKSLMWIRKSAEQGNEIAMEELGYKYYEGLGVEQDYAEAMKWLKAAAGKGKETAYASIGIMYRDGEGVEVDCSQAEKAFLQGAKAGNAYSAFLLGQLYAGYMKPAESQKAMDWYRKASDMGSYRANEVLAEIYREGNPELGIPPDSVLATKYQVRLAGDQGR